MASKRPLSSLSSSLAKPPWPQFQKFQCSRYTSTTAASGPPHTKRIFASSPDSEPYSQPRWAQTPQRMKAPFRSSYNPQAEYKCNEDPAVLDDAYVRILGKDGDKVLSEEVKWLAVTHKSFDQGRRGFNDRLGYVGRRIVELQTSLALLNAPRASQEGSTASPEPQADEYGRIPFQHPALAGLEGLTGYAKAGVLDRKRLAFLAERYGIPKVLRWRPRNPSDLKSSGIEAVLAQTLYAIVGAVALEKGGESANRIVRERILGRLGL